MKFSLPAALILCSSIQIARSAAGPADPQEILREVTQRQERLINHHIRFELTSRTAEHEDAGHYAFDRTLYGKQIRNDWDGIWPGVEMRHLRSVITPEFQKSCNTAGSDENYLGRIGGPDPLAYFMSINRDMSGPWLFGLANEDTDYVWRLMAAHPEKLGVSDESADGVRRIKLSANLPTGRYSLVLEPDFEYRIRRFAFEKNYSEGHLPPPKEEEKKDLPAGKDHFTEFIRGNFEVENYLSAGGLWFPSEGGCDYQFHYTHMDKPGRSFWRAHVSEFTILESPPGPGAFEMKWPPYAQISDHSVIKEDRAFHYYADKGGGLHPMRKLKIGDELPPIRGKQWHDPGNTVDLSALKGKYVFVDNWAVWCAGCVVELPEYQRIHNRYGNDPDLLFVGINAYDSGERLERLMTEKRIRFPQLLGEDARVAKNILGFTGAGEGLFVGPDGKVLENDMSPKRLEELIAGRVKDKSKN